MDLPVQEMKEDVRKNQLHNFETNGQVIVPDFKRIHKTIIDVVEVLLHRIFLTHVARLHRACD